MKNRKIYLIFIISTIHVYIGAQTNSDSKQAIEIKKNVILDLRTKSSTTVTEKKQKLQEIEKKLNTRSTGSYTGQGKSSRPQTSTSAVVTSGGNTSLADINELNERIEMLEERNRILETLDLINQESNAQTAAINLAAMAKQIKPLILFDNTRKVFTTISEISNLLSYPEYKEWFHYFQDYLEKNKKKESILNIVNTLLGNVGKVGANLTLTGPIIQPLISSITSFISSLGSGRAELKAKSEKMLMLTLKLAQFQHDLSGVDQEWNLVSNELEVQKNLFNNTMKTMLDGLGIEERYYIQNFYQTSDPNKMLSFYVLLKNKTEEHIKDSKQKDGENWKNDLYFQMIEVQDLKIKYGYLLHKMSDNILLYEKIIEKYENDSLIGSKVNTLKQNIEAIKLSFDASFSPAEFYSEAKKMYRVY